MYVRMSVYMYVVDMYIRTYVCTCTCILNSDMHIRTYMYMYVHVRTYMCIRCEGDLKLSNIIYNVFFSVKLEREGGIYTLYMLP